MTFDDDYCQFPTAFGPLRLTCAQLGYAWPPPEVIEVEGLTLPRDDGPPIVRPALRYKRLRYSSITDDQRAGLAHICRGAEYILDEPLH